MLQRWNENQEGEVKAVPDFESPKERSHCQNTEEPGLVLAMLSLTWYQNIQVEWTNPKYQTAVRERDGTSGGDCGSFGMEVTIDVMVVNESQRERAAWKTESWGAIKLGRFKRKWTEKERELLWEV